MLLQLKENCIEAGCDEAGRGCLAGPVVAAAVILPPRFHHALLNDSKQVSKNNRNVLREYIEKHAVNWAVGICSPQEIDDINILKASIKAMHKALDQILIPIEHIIVDGNKFLAYKTIPHQTVIKGDAKYMNIAAASILAKTYRDEIMEKLHIDFPQYGWDKNMGYPTEFHREKIKEFGVTEQHRKTFRLLNDQLSLFE